MVCMEKLNARTLRCDCLMMAECFCDKYDISRLRSNGSTADSLLLIGLGVIGRLGGRHGFVSVQKFDPV